MLDTDATPAPDEPATDKAREEVVERALNILTEHFEAVHIFGCYSDGKRSSRYDLGRGNYYTRYGMVRDWVNREERG